MRVLSAVLVLTIVLYTEQLPPMTAEKKARLKANVTACLEETGADVQIARSVWKTPDAPADNEPVKCFYRCMLLKSQMMDASGKLNDANLVKGFAEGSPADMKEIGEECDDIKAEADSCEFGYQIIKCVALTQLDRK